VTIIALEVYVVHDDALYKLTTFTFLPLLHSVASYKSFTAILV